MVPFTTTECVHCKAPLDFNTRGKLYCSDDCRAIVYKNRYKDRYRKERKIDPDWPKKQRSCSTCSTAFFPKSHNQKYCKRECWLNLSKFEYVHNNKHLLQGTLVQKWLKARIFVLDRDEFTCKYCGRSPMKEKSVTLHVDHKIPRKHGGTDDLDNLITSCEQCNLGKGDLLLNYWSSSKK